MLVVDAGTPAGAHAAGPSATVACHFPAAGDRDRPALLVFQLLLVTSDQGCARLMSRESNLTRL